MVDRVFGPDRRVAGSESVRETPDNRGKPIDNVNQNDDERSLICAPPQPDEPPMAKKTTGRKTPPGETE
jgi:hypothetical protein